ncbi:MAG: FHA domain-containing protein [Pseudomonadota bacterium]|nr:FHA domain-containing protein [Pseudomonadota bacterium]
MYPQFFGFDKLPFRLRPDPDFLYAGPEYLRARVKLLNCLHGRSRLLILTGPAGVGKTMLLEDVLRDIAGHFAVCRINQPHISAAELLQALSLQLGMTGDADNPASAAARSPEGVPLLVVDDAQLLASETVRALGDILNRTPRLKILLAGKEGDWQRAENLPRFDTADELHRVRLAPLSAAGTKAYVERRLEIAGGGGKELFTPDAHAMIFQHTAGAARLVNVLCDAALHAACARAAGHVSGAEILLAAQDSRWPEAVARDRTSSSTPVDSPESEAAPAGAPVDAPMDHPAPAAPPPRAPAPVKGARLIVSVGSQHVAAMPLEAGRTSIGRATDNSLRLDAPYISRHHCYVETIGNVSTIEDLGSVNGICVNGKMVKRHILQNEDNIILGEHVLKYVK